MFYGKGYSAIPFAVLLSAAAVPVQAQAPRAGLDEDIIVTAQRRVERLQDVPIAVSSISSNDLETRQISNTLDLINYIPNLIGHHNTALGTANTYSLRGLANTESISTFDPPIGTYVDDIYISRQGSNNFSFFDVERVEVLRGPQGTLFGRNTTGGAINMILRRPGDQLSGYAYAGFGRYNQTQLRGSIDLPVNEKLLTKVSAYWNRSNGYVDDLVTGQKQNGEDSWGVRGAVRALPSETVTWDLSASYMRSNFANLPNFEDAKTGKRVSYTPMFTDRGLGPDAVSSDLVDIALGNIAKSTLISSNLQIDLGEHSSINFITGYYHMAQKYMTDSFAGLSNTASVFDGLKLVTAVPGIATPLVNDSWTKQFSQEIKVTGSALNGVVDYVGGFYYVNERNLTNFANIVRLPTGTMTVNGDRVMRNDTEAYAGYLQADIHATPRLTLTAGIRYTDEDKNISYTPNANPLPRANARNQPFGTQDILDAGIPDTLRSKVWTPRFAVNYKVTPDIMWYASATRGFKSGGWNSRAYYPEASAAFTKETIWSFESGVRSEFLDHRLRINLTGFYFKDYDAQLPGGGFDPVTGTITYLTRNVADMKNYGLEGEVSLTPIDRLNVYWNFGLQHARYENLNTNTQDQIARCLAGNYANNCNTGIITSTGGVGIPTRAPSFTSAFGGNYSFDLGSGIQLQPSVNWLYVSSTWVSTSNDPAGLQRGHSEINAGLRLMSEKGWSLGIECDNCFNKTYVASFLIYPYLNQPGSWIVRAGYKF